MELVSQLTTFISSQHGALGRTASQCLTPRLLKGDQGSALSDTVGRTVKKTPNAWPFDCYCLNWISPASKFCD